MFHSATQNGYQMMIPVSFKNYHIIQLLGQGSTSVIAQVEKEDTCQEYAAKIISKSYIRSENIMDQIVREIEVLKSVHHPHIIKIYETFEIKNNRGDEFLVLITDLCSNGSILNYARQKKFKDGAEKRKMMLQFLEAIRYLHNRGISHGDIKPDNILIDHNLNVKICDFGYCRQSTTASDESKKGTLYYAAPELFLPGKFDTLKSDIWAIGITLYALSELHLPFKNGSTPAVTGQIVQGHLSFSYDASPKLMRLVKQCTQNTAANRPTIDDIIEHNYFNETDQKINSYRCKLRTKKNRYHNCLFYHS